MLHHGVYILDTEPLIVSFIGSYPLQSMLLYQRLKRKNKMDYSVLPAWFRPKYTLGHIAGWSAPWHRMARLKTNQVLHTLEGRSHHLMVNAQDEDLVRKTFLVRGAHFNHNIYINEHLYKPLSEPKLYDAIYTAQLAAFKRLWLAKNIARLMIVSYGGNVHTYCPELKHAEFNETFIPRLELARKYNQSYAGLCLSAVEGAMLASCEYLLCGIPIVSTPSKGGRDEFFDEQNSIIVPPDPDSVAQAVQHWKQNPPDPHSIREQTLKKMNGLRREYCNYIVDLIRKGGGGKKDPEQLMEKYFAHPDGTTSRFVKFDDLWKINLDDYKLD